MSGATSFARRRTCAHGSPSTHTPHAHHSLPQRSELARAGAGTSGSSVPQPDGEGEIGSSDDADVSNEANDVPTRHAAAPLAKAERVSDLRVSLLVQGHDESYVCKLPHTATVGDLRLSALQFFFAGLPHAAGELAKERVGLQIQGAYGNRPDGAWKPLEDNERIIDVPDVFSDEKGTLL